MRRDDACPFDLERVARDRAARCAVEYRDSISDSTNNLAIELAETNC